MNKDFNVIELSSLDEKTRLTMLYYVYRELKELENEYFGFENWYQTKVIGEIGDNREVIISLFANRIAGIAILKRGPENKICTLRVVDNFRGMGLGKALMEMSFHYLNTEKPLITVSSCKSQQFKNLFKFYNFKQEGLYQHKYSSKFNELTFNGILIENKHPIQGNLFTEENLLDLANLVKYDIHENINDYLIKSKKTESEVLYAQELFDYCTIK